MFDLMNQEEIKERQQQAFDRFKSIKTLASDFYLHWYNNYLSTELIAEHYEITDKLAQELIDLGYLINKEKGVKKNAIQQI
tara:strand:+ start:269 stop:511 length:243 start_codon:yes stop_codon:yes gene_type:complete